MNKMTLSDFIRQKRQDCQNEVIEPILEALEAYLAKELTSRDYAHIHLEYKQEKEEVNEDHAFVYYERKVALCAWLREQGFRYRDAICHLNGQITGINVSL
jgi:hypothetical protein